LEVLMAVFTESMINEKVQTFWAALQRGEFITDAAAEAGTYRKKGARWMAATGGVRPRRGRDLQGRYLSFAEREDIALARAGGESMRCIARRLGRSPATISRELRRNADGHGGYRATTAHALAYRRAGRPKPAKLATNLELRAKVQEYLQQHYSPEQIAGRLRVEFPDDLEMRVSPETIYQALYVQSRGALRRDLAKCLRTGRSLRQPGRMAGQRKNRIPDMINISERPAEAKDRAVPGHWEGDLMIGKRNASAIATLVERSTRLRDASRPTGGLQARAGRPSARIEDPDAARLAAPDADLGSGPGDARLEADPRRLRNRGVLLRSARPVAARHQREHQRAATPVLPQGV
jgi:transposase, IS30 family